MIEYATAINKCNNLKAATQIIKLAFHDLGPESARELQDYAKVKFHSA